MSKKTLAVIIESKNDYLVAVKKNQPNLYKSLENKSNTEEPVDRDISEEKNRGRTIKRTVEVYDNLSQINQRYWRGVQSFIKVVREGKRDGKPYHETVYYLSSKLLTAAEFNQRIREHWLIENQLHWVRDVVLEEDKSKIRTGNAPQNWAIIRSIVNNIFKNNGYQSLTEGIRMVSNNISYLWLCLADIF